MWGVRCVTSNETQHFVILLNDGTHLCSCFDHCNRGIVCRHFFQVMLCTQTAAFHIKLIRARWYSETSSDPAQESFLVAQKFEVEQSATMSWNGSVPYLSALNDIVYEMQDINRKTIDERKLYREAWGKARAALMVAIRRCDYNFISILDKYLNDCQELSSNSDSDVGSNSASNSESEDDADKIGKKKLDPKELMNPHKHKGKGRPKGTDRI
ncbi:hypothetical protein C2G38_2047015 [Gigaspora rosea]|uniref:SWIM-type domain-containing protein n=1 Tax=Gigaspora rosea TaxID=44941 RepID=A0A397UAT2_9GLOM|nr:hypothetical protein C2G38_2047015 [Gigaspora rosea]